MSGFNSDGSYFATKFDSARDEYLYDMCVGEWANDSDGDSEAPTGYFWQISNSPEELSEIVDAFGNLETRLGFIANELIVGYFIVQTNDQGFVYVEEFETQETLNDAYNSLTDEFSIWLEQDDNV